MHVAGFEGGVAGIRYDAEVGFRPRAMQCPCGLHRAHDVVAALHDDGRDVPDTIDAAQELVLALEETLVHEVVTFDARNRSREIFVAPLVYVLLVDVQVTRRSLPH